MFKTITRLLFGGVEETPEDVKSGEVVEEGWLVVSHQEAGPAEDEGAALTDTHPSSFHGDTVMESAVRVSDPEPTSHQSSSSSTGQAMAGSASLPKALVEVTQLTCVQKAKTRADPHHMSRNAIERQNRVRQGVHHHNFHLQQPGHRHLSH